MVALFAEAIKSTGTLATSSEGEFSVSIQPHEESGKLKFYAVLNGASEALVTGSKFAENGKTYIVEAVETYSYQGKGLFRKGVLREDKES